MIKYNKFYKSNEKIMVYFPLNTSLYSKRPMTSTSLHLFAIFDIRHLIGNLLNFYFYLTKISIFSSDGYKLFLFYFHFNKKEKCSDQLKYSHHEVNVLYKFLNMY